MEQLQNFIGREKERRELDRCLGSNRPELVIVYGAGVQAMSRGNIMLVATGSATSWMRGKLIENKGGLHSRITSQLHIAPFTLEETEKYLENIGSQSLKRYFGAIT